MLNFLLTWLIDIHVQINQRSLLIHKLGQGQKEVTWPYLVTLVVIQHQQYHGQEMDLL